MYAESSQSEVCEIAAQLYRDRHPHLLRTALANAASAADAEEALQEAFASFVRAFDPNGDAPPLAWLTLYADLCVMPTLGRKAASQAEIALRRSA